MEIRKLQEQIDCLNSDEPWRYIKKTAPLQALARLLASSSLLHTSHPLPIWERLKVHAHICGKPIITRAVVSTLNKPRSRNCARYFGEAHC